MPSKMKCSIFCCSNNRTDNPEKYLFVTPRSTSTRELWIKAAGKSFSLKSYFHVCEDHFDMKNDVEYYRVNGQPVLKCSVYPHRNLQKSDMEMQHAIDTINWTCFVPHCENKRLSMGKKVIFFPVPEGTQGIIWKSAITVYERNINETFADKIQFCCEEHFDINKDIEKIFHYNGLVEYKVKTGIVPTLKLESSRTPIISGNLNEAKQINLGDSFAHSRLILNNYISYLYNDKPPLTDNSVDANATIKVEPEDVSEIKMESVMDEDVDVKTEPIDLDYEDGCNSESIMKTEGNQLEADDSTSESETLDSNKEYVKDPDVKTEPIDLDYEDGCNSESIMETEGNELEADDSKSESLDSNKEYVNDPDVTTDDFSTQSEDSICSDDSEISSDLTFSSEDENMTERFECPYCQRLVRKLEAHVKRAHFYCARNLNKTICGLCSEKFVSRRHFRDHRKQVHNGNSYACDLCDYMTPVYRSIERHIVNIHSKETQFLCDICGKEYKFFDYLRRHIDWKHSGTRERKHACHMCDRKYFELNALKLHIRSFHLNERPYHCKDDGCNKAFRTKSSLFIHKQVHLKELFTCIVCEKKFTFKWNLRTHIKNIHGA